MSDARLASYARLWDGSEPGWMLLGEDPNDLAIYNEAGHILVIEDDSLAAEVIAAMKAAGVAVRAKVDPPPLHITPLPRRRG